VKNIQTNQEKHIDDSSMIAILNHTISDDTRQQAKSHINECRECWALWNRLRWDYAGTSKGVLELKEYLGDSFSQYYDSSWALAKEWNVHKRTSKIEVESFYQGTNNYLYNLILFYESGDRKDFKPLFRKIVEGNLASTVIDYGCGVGNDTLDMISAGLKVISIDFESPSLDFLRWRLKKRGISSEQCIVVPVEEIAANKEVCASADMFWGVDVLEHMFDPYEVLKITAQDIKIFAYYVDSDDKAGGRHPFHFKFAATAFNERLRLMGLHEDKDLDATISIWSR